MRVNLPGGILSTGLSLGLLGLWEAGVRLWQIPAFILPLPSAVFRCAVINWGLIWPHALATGLEIILGISLALVAAIPLAIFMFIRPGIEKGLAPFLVASQAVPVFALAPLLVIWLGYGIWSKVFMAWVIIFFPITISLLSGLKSCDPDYRRLFTLMGAGFWMKLRLLYWPWALPQFFSGLRVGVTVATIGAVIGEWVGAQKGLGYLMIQSNARLKTELVFACILWLTVMGLGLWGLVNLLEKRMIKWKTVK